MNTPHKCPCCDGWGHRTPPPLENATSAALPAPVPCVACKGSGVVWAALAVAVPPWPAPASPDGDRSPFVVPPWPVTGGLGGSYG